MQSHHILEYPKTKTLLWDHKSFGEAIVLNLFTHEGPKLYIKEHILGTAACLREKSRTGRLDGFFTGSVSVCKGLDSLNRYLRISLNKLCEDSLAKYNNDFCAPVTFIPKSRGKPNWGISHYLENLKKLFLHCSSSEQIDISRFIHLNVLCSIHGVRCDIHVELIAPSTTFRAIQIPPITIRSNTAVSLTAKDSQKKIFKTGFITMDSEKRLLLLTDCDTDNLNYPLMGIWTSGPPTIQHPVIYAACMRYITCQSYKSRLCLPPIPFLIVHFSSQNDHPTFFDCVCTTFTGEGILDYQLEEGDFTISLAKVPILDTKLVNIELKRRLGNKDFILAKMKIPFKNDLPASARLIIFNSNDFPQILVQPTIFPLKDFSFQVPDISVCSDSADDEEICDSLSDTSANKSSNRTILQSRNPMTFHDNVQNTLNSKFIKPIQHFNHLPTQFGILGSPPDTCDISSETVQSTSEKLQSFSDILQSSSKILRPYSDILQLPSEILQLPSRNVQSQFANESISQWVNESSQILNKTDMSGKHLCFEEMDGKRVKSTLEELSLANQNNTTLTNFKPTESFEQCEIQEIYNEKTPLSTLQSVHQKLPEKYSAEIRKNDFSTQNVYQLGKNVVCPSPTFSAPIYTGSVVDNLCNENSRHDELTSSLNYNPQNLLHKHSGENESQKDHNLHSFITQSNSVEDCYTHVCQKFCDIKSSCSETGLKKPFYSSLHDKQSLTINQNSDGGLFKKSLVSDSFLPKCYDEDGVKCSNFSIYYSPEDLKCGTGELKNIDNDHDENSEVLQDQFSEMLAKQEEKSNKMKELLGETSAKRSFRFQITNPVNNSNVSEVFKDNKSFEEKPRKSYTCDQMESDPISKLCADISEVSKTSKVEIAFEPHTLSLLKEQREALQQLQGQVEMLLKQRNESNNGPKQSSTFSDESNSNCMKESSKTDKQKINPLTLTSNPSQGSRHKNLYRSENERVSIGTMTTVISDESDQFSVRLSDETGCKNENKWCSVGTMTSFRIENDEIQDHSGDQINATKIWKSKCEGNPSRTKRQETYKHMRNAERKTNLKKIIKPTNKTSKCHRCRHSIFCEESSNDDKYGVSSFSEEASTPTYHVTSDEIQDHSGDQINATKICEKKPASHLRNAERKTNLKILNKPTSKTSKLHPCHHSIACEESSNEDEHSVSSFSGKNVTPTYHSTSLSQANSASIEKRNFSAYRDCVESSSKSSCSYSKEFVGRIEKIIEKQDHTSFSPPSVLHKSVPSKQKNSEGWKSEYMKCEANKKREKRPYNMLVPSNTMDCVESSSKSSCSYSKEFVGKVEKIIEKQDHTSSFSPPSVLHKSVSSKQRNFESWKSEYLKSQANEKKEEQPYKISVPSNTMTSENQSSLDNDSCANMSLEFQRLADKYLDEEDYREIQEASFELPEFSLDTLDYLHKHNLIPSTSSGNSKNEENVKKHQHYKK